MCYLSVYRIEFYEEKRMAQGTPESELKAAGLVASSKTECLSYPAMKLPARM